METRANHVLIGLLTLLTIAGAFAFAIWLQNGGATTVRTAYRVAFPGTVSGLRTGATVLYNGLPVGEVSDLRLSPRQPGQVLATLSVDRSVPVRRDTVIGLTFQGLTGIASVAMTGGTIAAPALQSENGEPPLLRADPDASQDVTQAARDVLRKLGRLIDDNEGALRSSIANLDKVSATLERNAGRFDRIMAALDSVAGGLTKMERMAGAARNALTPSAVVQQAADSMRALSHDLHDRAAALSDRLDRVTDSGLRSSRALASDGRRALATIADAARTFVWDPEPISSGSKDPAPAAGAPSR